MSSCRRSHHRLAQDPLHIVDVAGIGADGPSAVVNPSFADAGGSPYEGTQKPLCNTKLVTVSNGRSIAPTFNLFTDVPIPGKWKGYIIDDLTLSTNPQDLNYGEKAGVPNSPIGIYDFANRLVTTITSDPNGVYEVLLPSTYTINCPTPSGVCPGTYYLLGNDPGQPGALNPNYNPQFRTIGATFEYLARRAAAFRPGADPDCHRHPGPRLHCGAAGGVPDQRPLEPDHARAVCCVKAVC